MSNSRPELATKMVLRGDAKSGKTMLTHRLVGDKFSPNMKLDPTVGMNFKIKALKNVGPVDLRLQIWDTAGQERFPGIPINRILSDASVIAYCFDVTNEQSLKNAVNLLRDDYKHLSPGNMPAIVLIATKADLISDETPVITDDQIAEAITSLKEELKDEHNIHQTHFLTSAKSTTNPLYEQTTRALTEIEDMCAERALKRHQANELLSQTKPSVKRTSFATFFTRHPNVSMGLLITGLALSIALISLATVATCGVAGLLGAGIAAIAATATFGASLSTVGLVAGGVGLFGGLGIAGASYLIHTKARPALKLQDEEGPRFTC